MRPVKRESAASSRTNRSRGGAVAVDAASLRGVKRERMVAREREKSGVDNTTEEEEGQQELSKRRVLRSRYLAVIHEISGRMSLCILN